MLVGNFLGPVFGTKLKRVRISFLVYLSFFKSSIEIGRAYTRYIICIVYVCTIDMNV